MASIDRLPSGRWRVRWRGPGAKQQSKSFRAKADANAFKRQVESELDAGYSVSAAERRLTLGQFTMRRWLQAQPWRPSTREMFDSYWRVHIEPRWGDVPLGSIRRTDVQGWVNDLERVGLAGSTVKEVYGRLVSILRAAHADGILARQPAIGVRLPDPGIAGELHVPTDEQVWELSKAVPARYEALVWTIATLGLRPAEAVGLSIDRVDFLAGLVTIDRQLITLAGLKPQLAPLKSRRSPSRELPVPNALTERLALHIATYGGVDVEVPEDLGGGTTTLIFSNNDGRPIRRNGLSRVWRQASRTVGLPPALRGWHSLRHYGITRLIGAGVNPDYVRQFAGHTTLTETLNTYAGWWPSDTDDARDVLAAALESQTSQGSQVS